MLFFLSSPVQHFWERHYQLDLIVAYSCCIFWRCISACLEVVCSRNSCFCLCLFNGLPHEIDTFLQCCGFGTITKFFTVPVPTFDKFRGVPAQYLDLKKHSLNKMFFKKSCLFYIVSVPQVQVKRRPSVVSYEPFIVFAPSSSGYTSGQNLEVLYIIRNSIWNIFK